VRRLSLSRQHFEVASQLKLAASVLQSCPPPAVSYNLLASLFHMLVALFYDAFVGNDVLA